MKEKEIQKVIKETLKKNWNKNIYEFNINIKRISQCIQNIIQDDKNTFELNEYDVSYLTDWYIDNFIEKSFFNKMYRCFY